jgi:hypothetical protein
VTKLGWKVIATTLVTEAKGLEFGKVGKRESQFLELLR